MVDSTPLEFKALASGEDVFGRIRGLPMSTIAFKVIPAPGRDLLCLENTFKGKGGPPLHRHSYQDEWFYALQGVFEFEIGGERFSIGEGQSVLAPRMVPHAWAFVGEGVGRMLISFTPAGKMLNFFEDNMKEHQNPPADPEVWSRYDMELLGPPLLMR